MADQPSLTPTTVRGPLLIGAAATIAIPLILFSATLFVSSTLLFMVQPMVGKMLLPIFGGTPAVWNTCMVFFQAVLLAGYAYAHATTSWLGVRRQATVHLVVLLAPLFLLPIAAVSGHAPPTDSNPIAWLLWRLLVTVGVPFFVVSTSAPLLQKWFAGTGHPAAKDPYFLYAASNCGSLLALLGYPLLLEPAFALVDQSRAWTIGYAGLVLLAAACARTLWRSGAAAGQSLSAVATEPKDTAGRTTCPTFSRRMRWILLAFIPSSLMLGVTTHITTDLGTVPLLWVLPLALYLLTFVFVFARKPPLPHALMVRAVPFVILPLAVLTFMQFRKMGWLLIPVHLLMFFVAAMMCHGRLANSRPSARHLTEFYLWMSVGGVLGGAFNAIVAPLIFHSVAEYPLIMAVACLTLPLTAEASNRRRARQRDFILPATLALVAGIFVVLLQATGFSDRPLVRLLAFGSLGLICFSFKDRPIRFGLSVGVILLTGAVHNRLAKGDLLHIERNFFGVKRVIVDSAGKYRMMVHGGVLHGSQSTDPARRNEPLTYYHRSGPIGDVFRAFNACRNNGNVGVIGLGTGSMACYAQPGQHFTFYEIDPVVAHLAADPQYFTFLEQCRGGYDIVLGDGRLTLADAPDGKFDLFILDAFSSDAIPTHLATREAIELYMSKLADGGLLAFHVSNRYLDLKPVLANIAARAGLVCLQRSDLTVSAEDKEDGKSPSEYVVIARRPEDLGDLARDVNWRPVLPRPGMNVWTDQYSNILSLFRWR